MSANPYQNAIDIQNACNLSGVLYSFAKDMHTICETEGPGTEVKNTHPVVLMYLWKLCSLAQLVDVGPVSDLSEAQDLCMERAKTWGIKEVAAPVTEELHASPSTPSNVDTLINTIQVTATLYLQRNVTHTEARLIVDDMDYSFSHDLIGHHELVEDDIPTGGK